MARKVPSKTITVPVIKDGEVVRYKAAVTPEQDLKHSGASAEEIKEFYGEDDITVGNKASKAILKLSRVHHRHIEEQPGWFRDRLRSICQNHTPNQVQRLLKPWMLKKDEKRLAKYRSLSLGWNTITDQSKPPSEQQFVYGPDETIAYASYKLPGHFSILERIFTDLQALLPDFHPKTVLDFGCGPGTGGAATHSVWYDKPVERYVGVDVSQSMIDAAKIMVKGILPNHIFLTRSFDLVQRALKKDERFSLIICSYTLTELPTDSARQAATQMLFELLEKDGLLVFVEHGDVCGSHTVRSARQFIQSLVKSVDSRGKFNPEAMLRPTEKAEENAKSNREAKRENSVPMMLPILPSEYATYTDVDMRTIAPCSHDAACGLSPGRKCTFMQRVTANVLRLNCEEKFSYVVLQKTHKTERLTPPQPKEPPSPVEADIEDSMSPEERRFDPLFKMTPLELMNVITSVGHNADKWQKRQKLREMERLKQVTKEPEEDPKMEEDKLMKTAELLLESSHLVCTFIVSQLYSMRRDIKCSFACRLIPLVMNFIVL